MEEAAKVTSHFLHVGNVLLKKDSQGEITPVPVDEGIEALDTSMVVLVNGGTGSAA